MKPNYKNIVLVVGIVCVLGVFLIGSAINGKRQVANDVQNKNIEKQTLATPAAAEYQKAIENAKAALTNSPTPKEPTIPPKGVIEKINKIAEKYSDFAVTILNKNGEDAAEGQLPYEIILNAPFSKSVVSDCDGAKKLSYYVLETFYKDSHVRPTLSRIMITIPYYLRLSLGASDGVPMAENDSFSGPTNFWTVMEKSGLGENETGEQKDRTWAVYASRCE